MLHTRAVHFRSGLEGGPGAWRASPPHAVPTPCPPASTTPALQSKGLAVPVPGPGAAAARLKFAHRDDDDRIGASAFYALSRENHCVACGERGHFLRYRLVPSCYR